MSALAESPEKNNEASLKNIHSLTLFDRVSTAGNPGHYLESPDTGDIKQVGNDVLGMITGKYTPGDSAHAIRQERVGVILWDESGDKARTRYQVQTGPGHNSQIFSATEVTR